MSMQSRDEWFAAARRKGELARLVHDRKEIAFEAVDACGWACEFALKGVIMRRNGFNRWPTRAERPELYTHDLWKLAELAGIERASVPSHLRGRVKLAFSWNVEHRYLDRKTPRRVAKDVVDSVFGEDGVLEWLKTL